MTKVAAVQLTQVPTQATEPPAPGTLALVTPGGELDQRAVAALDHLLRDLKQRRASGLALHSPGRVPAIPPGIRTLAQRLQLPLLVTTADSEWAGINEDLQQQRALIAERQVEQLEALLNALPSQLANPEAASRIVRWLSEALEADVAAGSHERGVFTAAPESQSNLARSLVGGDSAAGADEAEHTQLVQILGADDGALLAVASRRAFESTAGKLIRHAAKLLGLCEQARLEHEAARSAVLAPRAVHQAATQLLFGGEVLKAQVIAGLISPALMDTDLVRVRIIDTGGQARDPHLQWCLQHMGRRSLVSPCPGKDQHIIVVTPTRADTEVQSDLDQLISARQGLAMGVSTPYPLDAAGAGYAEAAHAVLVAAHAPERVAVGAEPKIAPLLPRNKAWAWAQGLLAPLLKPEHKLLLQTLPTGLSYKPIEASKALGIHRNTLRGRLSRAGSLLGLELNSVNNRILLLLAFNILALPAPDDFTLEPAPDFAELIVAAGDTVQEWAERRLRKLHSDPQNRDLLTTVCAWLENDLSIPATAQALGVSDPTVRNHIKAASKQLGMDTNAREIGVHDTDVVTIADVGIAAFLVTGRPMLGRRQYAQSSAAG
ncbi:helix-turn-helix domain-containing protein [Streptomyces sp. NPDC001848]|uniref:helix-turn-helix domain-containing protein n=1 Tax=Streptomyces sp. NPDC001848 TaxID=3364618 RepID=UPI003675F41A